MSAEQPVLCGQSVIAEGYGDDCCGPQVPCGRQATWIHGESGAALCDEHEANARRFSSDTGRWGVGKQQVSYPDGWSRTDDAVSEHEAAPTLEIVRFD